MFRYGFLKTVVKSVMPDKLFGTKYRNPVKLDWTRKF